MMKNFMMLVALVSVLAISGCKATVKVKNLNEISNGPDIRVFLLTEEEAEDINALSSTTSGQLNAFLSNSKVVAVESTEKFKNVCPGNHVLLAIIEEVWQRFADNETVSMQHGSDYSTSDFEATKKAQICFTVATPVNINLPPEIVNLNDPATRR